MTERKPWRMAIGAAIGLVVGALLWWVAYEPGLGPVQNVKLLLFPVAAGILVVITRNWLKQVGPFDPDVQEANKRGRL